MCPLCQSMVCEEGVKFGKGWEMRQGGVEGSGAEGVAPRHCWGENARSGSLSADPCVAAELL